VSWFCSISFIIVSSSPTVALESYIKCLFPLPHSKSKAVPIQACTDRKCCSRLRLPDFVIVGTWRWEACQPYTPAPQGNISGTHFSYSLSWPDGRSATEGLC
jgi:hypothetical protein